MLIDFTETVSSEAAILMDCLFLRRNYTTVSKKTILSLLLPFCLLILIYLFWMIKHKNDRKKLARRLVLSTLVVIYISYIGLARRLFSILRYEKVLIGITSKDACWKRFWSQDTSVPCFEDIHAFLFGFFAVPLAITVLLGVPVSIGCVSLELEIKTL